MTLSIQLEKLNKIKLANKSNIMNGYFNQCTPFRNDDNVLHRKSHL